MAKRKRILVAPLNWGLGHATRCIPIIHKLREKGFDVVIAASERPFHLLKKEFPELTHIYFPNYEIDYPEKGSMGWHLIKKAPYAYRETLKEHRKLKKLIWRYKIKGIISDNRFGLYSKLVPCVIMSHQLQLEMPKGWGFIKGIVNRMNVGYLKKFNTVWIPDSADEPNLSGTLSHFKGLPATARYLGIISRFTNMEIPEGRQMEPFDMLISISGPEPQRTILENRLTEQALKLPFKVLMVVGRTEDGKEKEKIGNNIIKIAHLNSERMFMAMKSAKYIVCRSGYTTVMDLAALGQKAAFIPTPGQPEQEYIAEIYKKQGLANYASQDTADLFKLIEEYDNYKGFAEFKPEDDLLDKAIDEFLALVQQR
jgi:UDP:flavonoid glycosyltransferase YjiC (YdhE family)